LHTRGAKAPIAAEIAEQTLNFFNRRDRSFVTSPKSVRRLWNTDSEFSADERAGELETVMPDRMESRLRIAGHHDCSTCSTPGETPTPGW